MQAQAHLRHEIITCGVSNAFFNGVIAWLLLRSGPALTWTGKSNFMVDIIATALLLPAIVAAIIIPLQRRKLRAQLAQPIDLGPRSLWQRFANKLPASAPLAALCFALVAVFTIAPATLLGMYALGVTAIEPLHYAVFKGVWAGLMAAVLALPMVLVALRAPAPQVHRAPPS